MESSSLRSSGSSFSGFLIEVDSKIGSCANLKKEPVLWLRCWIVNSKQKSDRDISSVLNESMGSCQEMGHLKNSFFYSWTGPLSSDWTPLQMKEGLQNRVLRCDLVPTELYFVCNFVCLIILRTTLVNRIIFSRIQYQSNYKLQIFHPKVQLKYWRSEIVSK